MDNHNVSETKLEKQDPPMRPSGWLVSVIDDDEMPNANSKMFAHYHDARRHARNLVKDGVASFVILEEITITRCYSTFKRGGE